MSNHSLQRRIQDLEIDDDDLNIDLRADESQANSTHNEAVGEHSRQNESASSNNQANQSQSQANLTRNEDENDLYAPDDLLNFIPEEEELEMEARRRLLREHEGNGAHLDGRLVAPPNEVQRRNYVSKKNQIDALRAKQLELVDLQIDLNKVLVDTAKLVQEREQILLAQAKANNIVNVNSSNSDE